MSSVIYTFLVFSRKRNKLLIKSISIFVIIIPLIFISLHLKVFKSTDTDKTYTESSLIFPRKNNFYENQDYSLFITENNSNTVKKAVLIAKKTEINPFSTITDSDIRISGKNSFYIKENNEELLFSDGRIYSENIRRFFRIFNDFTNQWKEEASVNSISLLFKISVFIAYILAVTASFSVSLYPVVNFTFYLISVLPAFLFIPVYKRIILPEMLIKLLPPDLYDIWGYLLITAISAVFIIKKALSSIKFRKIKK